MPDPEFDFLVVGSGPSGAHAAQEIVAAGFKVGLIDIGFTDPKLQDRIPKKPFWEIRRNDPEQHTYFLGDDPATTLRNQERAGAHLTPPRQHMIREMDTLLPLESDSFAPLQSTGLGGLGISWGANCFALEDFELEKIGIPPGELRSYYAAAALEVGISGRTDDCLAPMIANMDHTAIQPPLPIDTNAETILRNYQRKEAKFNAEGFYLGQSLLAMLSQTSEGREANPLYDMDFWADFGRSVYRPQYTVAKLKAFANFTHLSGRLVTRFVEEGDVAVECRHIESGACERFTARKLLLAAGAINSGRLALASANEFEAKLPILCNRNHWIAGINLPMLGRFARDSRHSLSQLTLLMKAENQGPDYVLAQIYSYRSLLLFRMLKSIPLPPRLGVLFLRLVATAFTCVNVHYPDRPSPDRWLQLKSESSDDAVLRVQCDFTPEENRWLEKNEGRLLKFLIKLRCIPLGVSRPAHGASIHYGGTLPYSEEDRPFTTSPDGRLNGTKNVYVADSANWRFMPAKGLTLTVMANARRIANEAMRAFRHEGFDPTPSKAIE